MGAIKQAFCDVAKRAFLDGVHQPGHTYKVALYGPGTELGAKTAAYSTTGEVTGPGYTAGGVDVKRLGSGAEGGSAWLDFEDAVWPVATVEVAGALLYNATAPGRPAICTLDFGGVFRSTNGEFKVEMPKGTKDQALVRIA